MLSVVLLYGYVIDTIGPFAATVNNASTTESILELNNTLQLWTKDGDILLVNRSFRACNASLAETGFDIRIPTFSLSKQKQLPIADANTSRLITKNRWIAEACHERIKKMGSTI